MTSPRPVGSERARVVRVIARMNVGGPALQVTAMARHLDQTRFEQHLLVGVVADDEADYLELRAPDVAVTRVPGLGRSVRVVGDARALWFIYRYLRRVRPDIVHTHTAKAGLLGRVAAVAARVPVRVHTFHGHLLHGYFPRPVTKVVVIVERLLARTTHGLVAVGERVRDDLLEAGVGRSHQYVSIAPGVQAPSKVTRREARDALGLPVEPPVVVFIGRLTQIKRAERFVDLAREVARLEPEAVFAIVGDGPLRVALETRNTQIGAEVRFLGWRADMSGVYTAADLVVLTSDNEGMPVVLIEAAMHSVPAVATDVGAVRQVVDDGATGVVVRLGATEAQTLAELTAAVAELLRDGERRRSMGAAAKAKALAEFSEERLVSDIDALYSGLLEGRATRSSRRRASAGC